ncbi:hypothetical protein AJ78_08665 [Emergomyces pasteurianus Ep9510]|uniref:CBM21 domain-containing protein n=1 Tax=Emergomyces pasteurianus Ep9510 TaxID=1447872 RepID=A0A1J9Q522_9EURO|nr:hypothetical protein AJ78_08665 [Emergomyces pasteurianus Ep9510]
MPYTAPAPSLTSQVRPQLASAGSSSSAVRDGRHNFEQSVSPVGYSYCQPFRSSSSYPYHHRRSSSNPQQHMSNLRGQLDTESNSRRRSSSSNSTPRAALWKSPSGAMILTGVVISPPDSKSNSSDEEEKFGEGSKMDVPSEGGAVVMSNDQNSLLRTAPSTKTSPTSKHTPSPLDLSLALATEAQQPRVKPHLKKTTLSLPHPNSSEVATHTPEDSDRGEDEMDLNSKPSMVRKKSGELVRPALRPRRRPRSAPGTPVFSKAVHFDSQLEHIRHFLQLDRPLAVSAGSSPVETYDGDSEFPFGMDANGPPKFIEWEARIANFPENQEARKTMPVRLERIFLSPDNKNLVGVVSVVNISFQKHVVARFTLDYWKTTSEVVAEYNNDVRRKQAKDGYDRFNFTIHLGDMGNLESKRMFICIRYNVNGLEFWDNNNLMNYHVDFLKKPKVQSEDGKSSSSRPAGAPPRSRPSCLVNTRSRSVPPFPADSGLKSAPSPTIPNRQPLSESEVKSSSSSSQKDDDFLDPSPIRRNVPAPQTFRHRYDFGVSLSAAMQPGSADQTRRGKHSDKTIFSPDSISRNISGPMNAKPARCEPFQPSTAASPGVSQLRTSPPGPMKPTDLLSGQPYHQSPMYKELVDKYCFYGSSKTGSQSTNHFSGTPAHNNLRDDGTTTEIRAGARSDPTPSPSSLAQDSSIDDKLPLAANSTSQPSSRYTSPSRSSGAEQGSPNPPSPARFTLPYHQSIHMTLSETPTPTFIRG